MKTFNDIKEITLEIDKLYKSVIELTPTVHSSRIIQFAKLFDNLKLQKDKILERGFSADLDTVDINLLFDQLDALKKILIIMIEYEKLFKSNDT